MTTWRRFQGAKAKASGDVFEIQFENAARFHGCAVTKFPLGCKRVGAHKLIQIKTPFDWIVSYKKQVALIDTKTSQKNCFGHANIELHQAQELSKHEDQGVLAGYVIELKASDSIIFVPASQLLFRAQNGRGSINPDDQDVVLLGKGLSFDVRKIFE